MATPDSMQDFIRYHRRMFGLMIGACLAVFAVLLAVMRQDTAWAGGFAVGAAAQLVKFGFLDIAVIKKIAAEKKDPAVTQLKAMLVSLALFGAAVVFVYTFALNVWTMAAGIFLPRLILLADAYIRPNPFGTGTEAAAAEETGE
ncbi:MAG: hypothetical protein LUE17_00330 [Planctomycetaceae bacterium]|nr:hypothetical protein [Planctomycetaceae bacterium]